MWSQSRILSVLSCVTVLFLLSAPAADAVTIVASDDTWVREDNDDSNRNDNDQMNLRTNIAADDNDVILLRFPLTDLTGPAPGATLRLFWQRTTDDSAGKIMQVYGLNEGAPRETTWMEEAVIYGVAGTPSADDAPGLISDGVNPSQELVADPAATEDALQDLDVANTTFLGQLEIPDPGAVEGAPLDFSSTALTSFINSKTNGEVTLLLFRDATDSSHQLRFWPKEQGMGSPSLVIVPEPASVALIGLGSVALVGFRRRQR